MKIIAYIRTEFPDKFGIPRQSGLVDTKAEILFTSAYRNPDAVRGMEEYSHLWLIWQFSESMIEQWRPTVRPPRLGGNQRVGVFATRSPFRPNPLGLSCVRLDRIVYDRVESPILQVTGADLMDGTPIYDIKPYLSYVDSHPEARGGFADRMKAYGLEVEIPKRWRERIPEEKIGRLVQILSQDPRPSYHADPMRVYGMRYAGMEVKFRVEGACLTVCQVEVYDPENLVLRKGEEQDEISKGINEIYRTDV